MKSIPNWINRLCLSILGLGLVLYSAACTPPKAATALSSGTLAGQPCSAPACSGLVILQDGSPSRLDLASLPAQGQRKAAAIAAPPEITANGRILIDTGQPSPDGKWIAYTSITAEGGGPVLLQSQADGAWTNLIEAVNAHLPQGQAPLQQSYLWDVIGWFPASDRLLVGPTDLSLVVVVDLPAYSARLVPFPGGGKGGRLFVNLAPDGKSFVFIGETPQGDQMVAAHDLASGTEVGLLQQPYAQGVLYNPRYSPDQKQLAFLEQSGKPENGLTFAIDLLAGGQASATTLVSGALGLTVPVWSPDGSKIAYTRMDGDKTAQVLPNATLPPESENIWVVTLADGKQSQVSFLNEQVRSPVWAKDSQTLAFIGGDGRVEMASLAQPGKTWLAAGPSQHPELSSVFFLSEASK